MLGESDDTPKLANSRKLEVYLATSVQDSLDSLAQDSLAQDSLAQLTTRLELL